MECCYLLRYFCQSPVFGGFLRYLGKNAVFMNYAVFGWLFKRLVGVVAELLAQSLLSSFATGLRCKHHCNLLCISVASGGSWSSVSGDLTFQIYLRSGGPTFSVLNQSALYDFLGGTVTLFLVPF